MTNEHLSLIANELINMGIKFYYNGKEISIDLKYYRHLCDSRNCGIFDLLYGFCLTNGFDLLNNKDMFYIFISSK